MPSVTLRTAAPTLTCPAGKPQVYYTDTETKRLRLKVSRSGRHVWDWRTASQTEVLGVFDPTGNNGLSYEEAKGRADRLNLALNRGESVEAAAAAPAPVNTVGELLGHYLAKVEEAGKRERHDKETYRGAQSSIKPILARHAKLPIVDFSKHLLMKIVADSGLAGRVAGVKLIKTFRAAFNRCQRDGVLPPFDRNGAPLANPASHPRARRAVHAREIPRQLQSRLERRADRRPAARDRGVQSRLGQRSSRANRIGGDSEKVADGLSRRRVPAFHRLPQIRGAAAPHRRSPDDAAIIAEHKTDHTGEPRIIHLTKLGKRVLADAAKLRAEMRYDGSLVFPSSNGNIIAAVDDYLATACEIAKIKRLVPHSLRSIYINFSVRSGTPIEIASKNVGHEIASSHPRPLRGRRADDPCAACERRVGSTQ